MRKWNLLLCLATALGSLLAYYYNGASLEGFRPNLLTIIFTVTTFSVTFSIGGFNSSAYRQFHRSIPPRLLVACLAALAITLVPLALLVFYPPAFVLICLFVLPLLLLTGAILLGIGQRETDPIILLNRLCSKKAIEAHLQSLAPRVAARIAETEALALSGPSDRPTHEFSWHLAVLPEPEDPLTHLATLGLLSIQHGDLAAFGGVVKRFLEILELVDNVKLPKTTANDYRIREDLRTQVFDAFHRLTLALQKDKGTVPFARVAVDTLAEFVTAKTKSREQATDLAFAALRLMQTLATHCYSSGSTHELRVPVIVGRQIVQKGLDDPPPRIPGKKLTDDEALFNPRLAGVTRVVKQVGTYAIEQKDTELLYRCFDAFGWLGCSAVKHQREEIANACLRALCQLGREVRHEKLECFWSRCPLRPEDHALERINDITTWLSSIPGDRRERFVALVEATFSRFYGKETTLTFERQADGKEQILTNTSEKDHVEGFMMNAGAREVNYADFTFLKDLELRGGRGILMQGPVVPLTFVSDNATTSDPKPQTT